MRIAGNKLETICIGYRLHSHFYPGSVQRTHGLLDLRI
jgi:hypothetical protein